MKKSEHTIKSLKEYLNYKYINHLLESELYTAAGRDSVEEIPYGGETGDGIFLIYLKDGVAKMPYYWMDYGDDEIFRVVYVNNLKMVNEKDIEYLTAAKSYLEDKINALSLTIEKQRLRTLTNK